MGTHADGLKPRQFRLPAWAREYLEEKAGRDGKTKTAVVLEALSCLRSAETEQLMAEGYEEMRETGQRLAEEGTAAGAEITEW